MSRGPVPHKETRRERIPKALRPTTDYSPWWGRDAWTSACPVALGISSFVQEVPSAPILRFPLTCQVHSKEAGSPWRSAQPLLYSLVKRTEGER